MFCTEKVRFPIFEGQHIFAIWQCMQKRNKQNLFRSLPGGNRDKWTLHFWNFCLELSPIIHKLPIYELLTIFNDIGMCFFRFIVFAAKVFPFLLLPLSPVKKKKKKWGYCLSNLWLKGGKKIDVFTCGRSLSTDFNSVLFSAAFSTVTLLIVLLAVNCSALWDSAQVTGTVVADCHGNKTCHSTV